LSIGVLTSVSSNPSLGETAWEEVARAALDEGPVPRVPTPNETMRVLIQVEVAATDALSCAISSRVNEAEPRPKEVPSGGSSTPGPPRGLGSHPPRDTSLGDSMPVPGSLDIMDSGANELGLSSYP
jgi:hypothetical protein